MTVEFLIDGICIGLIFGMPIGAVGAMSIQRTIRQGSLAGLISGMASSFADVLYACVGAFGLTVVSDFLLNYKVPINLIGAMLLIIIAFKMIIKKEVDVFDPVADSKGYVKMFFSSFAVAITNPAAILSFLFAFSVFDIQDTLSYINGFLLILGVFIGTLFWWLLLVVLVSFMKKKITAKWMIRLNTIFACVLMIFACGVCINAF